MSNSRLDALNDFLKDDPNDPFTHYAIALEYAGMRDMPKAMGILEELMRTSPAYVPAYQQLGALYAQSGRTSDALKVLESGIIIARKSGDHHAAEEMEELVDDLEDEG